ncbi:MAG: hypothetical protein HC853_15055 [Anaerolineae bacterium]|nr:hypothetical protein [Anaerolineae bacterium]
MCKAMPCAAGNALKAGTMVSIEGMGKTFSGNYYVTSVVHALTADAGYETRFSVQRSAA